MVGVNLWVHKFIYIQTERNEDSAFVCLKRENGQYDDANSWALYEWLIVGIDAAYDDGDAEAAV